MQLSAQQSNIVQFVDDIFTSFEIIAEQKGINYTFNASLQNLFIWFDAEKLERVIVITSYSIHYTKLYDPGLTFSPSLLVTHKLFSPA